MTQRNDGGPAYPIPCQFDASCGPRFESGYGGMSLRQYAAIKLRVPDSGTDWLDDMIRQSLRDEAAARAMQGWLASYGPGDRHPVDEDAAMAVAKQAYAMADAMLAAREGS